MLYYLLYSFVAFCHFGDQYCITLIFYTHAVVTSKKKKKEKRERQPHVARLFQYQVKLISETLNGTFKARQRKTSTLIMEY